MTIGRICSRQVATANADETLRVAAERMWQCNVGSLVVVDEDQAPLGILTDRDIVVRGMTSDEDLDPRGFLVGTIMTRDPATVSRDASIEDAVSLMRAGQFRRLVVVSPHGKVVGVVTVDDVMSLLAEEIRDVGGLVEVQTAPRGYESNR